MVSHNTHTTHTYGHTDGERERERERRGVCGMCVFSLQYSLEEKRERLVQLDSVLDLQRLLLRHSVEEDED
jgi:hypothetical protein